MKMKRIIAVILTVLLVTVLLVGCTEKGELNVLYGETAQLQLKKEYASLTWESSDTGVATVENGAVSGVGPGQATVTALQDAKVVGEFTVSVDIIAITDIFLQFDEVTLDIGGTTQLGYSVFPTNASDYGITYTSINPDVATIDETGKVVGVAPGKTNLVVSTLSGITASCEVIVEEPSALEKLNEEESKVFNYMVDSFLKSFYNASGARLRNIYTVKAAEDYVYSAESVLLFDLQGTNKLGGTLFKYYIVMLDEEGEGFYLPCPDDFTMDDTYIDFPRDIIDYRKINAALDEYWGNTIVIH